MLRLDRMTQEEIKAEIENDVREWPGNEIKELYDTLPTISDPEKYNKTVLEILMVMSEYLPGEVLREEAELYSRLFI